MILTTGTASSGVSTTVSGCASSYARRNLQEETCETTVTCDLYETINGQEVK